MRLDVLTPENSTLSSENIEAVLRGDGSEKDIMHTIRLVKQTDSWRNAVAITWSEIGSAPKCIGLDRNGDIWNFTAEGVAVEFDWASGTAKIME